MIASQLDDSVLRKYLTVTSDLREILPRMYCFISRPQTTMLKYTKVDLERSENERTLTQVFQTCERLRRADMPNTEIEDR
jgi:hypothetical protein